MSFWENPCYFKANCVCLSSPLLDLPTCPWGWPCPVPTGGFLTPKPFLVLDRLRVWLDPKGDIVQAPFFTRIWSWGYASSQRNSCGPPPFPEPLQRRGGSLEGDQVSCILLLMGFKSTMWTSGFWLILNVKSSRFKVLFLEGDHSLN